MKRNKNIDTMMAIYLPAMARVYPHAEAEFDEAFGRLMPLLKRIMLHELRRLIGETEDRYCEKVTKWKSRRKI